jgi:hypothetical protein
MPHNALLYERNFRNAAEYIRVLFAVLAAARLFTGSK